MEILKGEKKNRIPIITKGRKIDPSKAHSLCFTYMISNPVQQFEIKSSVR
jgi:hypothetical protein